MGNNRNKKKSTIPLDVHLGVTAEQLEEAGVLNVVLGIDTKLFIDPKLLDETDIPEFNDARKMVTDYFDKLMKIYAQASLSERLQDIVLHMIAIKEPIGLSIGYGNSRDSGIAIPESVADASLRSLREMIAVGINDVEVMELLGLFIKNFGSDSISDLIAHIVYDRLCQFTQRVSKDLKVQTKEFVMPDGSKYQLPVHPIQGKQIVFVPLNFLSPLPLATSWREVRDAAATNARTRRDLNMIIGPNIAKFTEKVKNDPNILVQSADDMRTILDIYRAARVRPYDIDHDPTAYYRLADFASRLARASEPVAHNIKSLPQMIEFIEKDIIGRYRRHIEELGANKFLYQRTGKKLLTVDPTKPVHEDAAQILFFLIADDACAADEVLVSREPVTAAGAVDFSMGNVPANKVLVEIKKSNNGSLLDGYKKQIARYIRSEKAADAFYVVVVVDQRDNTNEKSKLNELKKLHADRVKKNETTPHLVVINGLIRLTASKEHGDEDSV